MKYGISAIQLLQDEFGEDEQLFHSDVALEVDFLPDCTRDEEDSVRLFATENVKRMDEWRGV